jgi:hypothetical protein
VHPCTVAIVIAEDGQLPDLDDGLPADLLFPAGDVVENQLGDVGVVADDDEDRRGDAASAGLDVVLPEAVILLVVAVETEQRTLQLDGELRFAAQRLCFASLFGRSSPVIELSATGTRGTLTMPASMASISEKSETTHGKTVPSG